MKSEMLKNIPELYLSIFKKHAKKNPETIKDDPLRSNHIMQSSPNLCFLTIICLSNRSVNSQQEKRPSLASLGCFTCQKMCAKELELAAALLREVTEREEEPES